MPESKLVFGRYRLDLSRNELFHDDVLIPLPPLTFRLLAYLALNRTRTVSQQELITELWGGLRVSESSLTQALKYARRAVGDSGQAQRIIRTVRGFGYRFVATIDAPADRDERPIARGDTLVGRAQSLTALESLLDRALSGTGAVALVTGDGGIGKTRLAEEFAKLATRRGAIVAHGAAIAQSGMPPYWPWIRVFRDLSHGRATQELANEIRRLAPQFLDPAPTGDSGAEHPTDDTARFRVYDAANQWLQRAAAIGPLVLILDDLHAAGASSFELLEFIASEVHSTPLVIVAAYRPAEALRDPPTASVLARLDTLPSVHREPLMPLDSEDAVRLVLHHSSRVLPATVAEEVARRSMGNPFFAIELARFLDAEANRGAVPPSLEGLEESLPRGAQQLIASRLGSLSPATRQLLRTAASIGRSFDPAFLALVESRADVTQSIEEACDAGILVALDLDRTTLAFSHDLVREAVYVQLTTRAEERRRTHLRIAEALAALDAGNPIETAFHLAAAAPLGGAARTVEALRRAGAHARSIFDDEQAWLLYRRGLDLLRQSSIEDEALQFELLTSAGEAGIRGPHVELARGLLREAIEIAKRNGWVEPFCRACLSYAYRAEIVGTVDDEIVLLIEEALDRLGDSALPIRARLLSRLAIEVRYRASGGLERALALVAEAVATARSAKDPAALARTLEDASGIRWSAEDPEAWIALNREIVRAASQAGDVDLQFRGVKGLATGYMEIGDRLAMERAIGQCHAMATEWPTPYLRGVATSLRGAEAMLHGRFDEGEARALEVLRTGIPGLTPLASVQLFYHRLELDRLGELEAATRSLAESLPGVTGWRFAIVRVLASMGRLDEAIEEIRRVGRIDNLPRDRNWLPAMALYAEVLPSLRDETSAAAHFERLRPYARVNVVLGNGSLFYGNNAYFLGLLATSLERWDEAEQMFDAAEAMHAQLASRPWILRVAIARAELRSECGDRDGALALIEEFAPEAESLGMIALAKQAAAIGAMI